ncbi:aquaporin 1, partial [Clarias magur]
MASELRTGALWRAVIAELVGMTLFVFMGIASAIGEESSEVHIALAFGLAIATLAQSIGHVSGAHLNPAITLGLLVSCQISAIRAALYILAQMLGAVVGSGIVYGIRPKGVKDLGLNKIAENMTPGKAFGVEFIATLQLVLCVLAATDSRRNDVKGSAPLAIGLSVGLGHFVAISYTGCGINPARTFGPAVIDKYFKNHW